MSLRADVRWVIQDTDHILLGEIYMHRAIEKEATDYGTHKEVKTYSFTLNGATTDNDSVDF